MKKDYKLAQTDPNSSKRFRKTNKISRKKYFQTCQKDSQKGMKRNKAIKQGKEKQENLKYGLKMKSKSISCSRKPKHPRTS